MYFEKYYTILIKFDYNPKENSSILGSIKRMLKRIPKEMKTIMGYDRPILFLTDISHIKKPVSIKLENSGKTLLTNRAIGFIIMYEYLGLDGHTKKCNRKLKLLLDNKLLNNKLNYIKSIEEIKLFFSTQK